MTPDEQHPESVALERRGVEVRRRLAARVDLLERRGHQALALAGRVARGAKAFWPVAVVSFVGIGLGVWAYRRWRRPPLLLLPRSRKPPAGRVVGLIARGLFRNLAAVVARRLVQRAASTWADAPAVTPKPGFPPTPG